LGDVEQLFKHHAVDLHHARWFFGSQRRNRTRAEEQGNLAKEFTVLIILHHHLPAAEDLQHIHRSGDELVEPRFLTFTNEPLSLVEVEISRVARETLKLRLGQT